MKKENKTGNKPNKVKQLYDQMQKKKSAPYWQQNKPGRKGKGGKAAKLKLQPRNVTKQFDRF